MVIKPLTTVPLLNVLIRIRLDFDTNSEHQCDFDNTLKEIIPKEICNNIERSHFVLKTFAHFYIYYEYLFSSYSKILYGGQKGLSVNNLLYIYKTEF